MFYDIYIALCKQVGKSPSAVAQELGINKSNVSNWKNNGYTPRGSVLNKIAAYFDVPVSYLLGGEAKEMPAKTRAEVTDDDIKFALFHGAEGITDEMFDEVKRFAEFVKEREHGKR